MTTLTLETHLPVDQMPPADQDVLLFIEGEEHADLGAYLGLDADDEQMWVDSMGARIHEKVVAWCELPSLAVLPVGQPQVKLNPGAAWPFPPTGCADDGVREGTNRTTSGAIGQP